jgi:predicted 2-oxoglutarate/Fe(II)-dependent dioxygenase YbiX
MGPHVDDEGITIYNHIASILYLNDDYSGGELCFLDRGICLSPKAGDLIVFPGNKNYKHEVSLITSGERYTIPLWSRFEVKP